MRYVAIAIGLVLLGCNQASAPTVSLSASPAAVKQGQCATLTWSTTNASKVSIDQDVGSVNPSGTHEVCPGSTTQYTITAAGEGGSRTAATTVSVMAPATKIMTFPEAALFEFGKAELKPEGKDKIAAYREGAKEELSRADKVIITGYTDNVGEPGLQLDALAAACGSGPRLSDKPRCRSQKVPGQRRWREPADRRQQHGRGSREEPPCRGCSDRRGKMMLSSFVRAGNT